jgi:hypothetical protein
MLSLEVEVDLGILGYTEVSVYFSTHTDSEPYSIGENDHEREYTVVDIQDVKLLGVSVVHLIDDCELVCISESVLEMLEEE